jgi:hypothetical protein
VLIKGHYSAEVCAILLISRRLRLLLCERQLAN